jgi:hypothetical protein
VENHGGDDYPNFERLYSQVALRQKGGGSGNIASRGDWGISGTAAPQKTSDHIDKGRIRPGSRDVLAIKDNQWVIWVIKVTPRPNNPCYK